MLPYFAAAGHNLYTKSVYLYVQQMISLPVDHANFYSMFVEGRHVIRRSDRYGETTPETMLRNDLSYEFTYISSKLYPYQLITLTFILCLLKGAVL